MATLTDEQFKTFMEERKKDSEMEKAKQEKCPTCGARMARESRMRRFNEDLSDFIRSNRIAKLDSCIQCVRKHVARAMVYHDEITRASGSGMKDGTASINVPINHLKIIGHLGCAIEESDDYPELNALLTSAERAYRYEGLEPDWDKIAEIISITK